MLRNRPGLSEIAFVPCFFAAWTTLVTAFWWTPHLWRQSWDRGAIFAASALACFVLLQVTVALAYAGRHGIPSLLTLAAGFGLVAWQVWQTWALAKGGYVFTLSEALWLNHFPAYAVCALFMLKWILFGSGDVR